MREIRRIDLIWQGDEIGVYEELKKQAIDSDKEISELVKEIIQNALLRRKTE
jgi:hypothetical protein